MLEITLEEFRRDYTRTHEKEIYIDENKGKWKFIGWADTQANKVKLVLVEQGL